jgi:hypothetical protein
VSSEIVEVLKALHQHLKTGKQSKLDHITNPERIGFAVLHNTFSTSHQDGTALQQKPPKKKTNITLHTYFNKYKATSSWLVQILPKHVAAK